MTNQFAMISEELVRCNWYLLPIELQRIYLTFLFDTQKPENILSYGGIECKRQTAKKVLKKKIENSLLDYIFYSYF